jgi:hypothetical protein
VPKLQRARRDTDRTRAQGDHHVRFIGVALLADQTYSSAATNSEASTCTRLTTPEF